MASKGKIIELKHSVALPSDQDLLVDTCTVTPAMATQWLKANTNNRPLSHQHVDFLTKEILEGNWQLNGQAIIVADDESVLDGQHRLHAVIKSGKAIRTLVIYGIKPEAFKTIDTGKKRTAADALSLETHNRYPRQINSAAASAARLCIAYSRLTLNSRGIRLSNTEVIKYLNEHEDIWQCALAINSYNKEQRPIPVGGGAGLYYLMGNKDEELADEFMRGLYTGEELKNSNPTIVCREMLLRDQQRHVRWAGYMKLKLVIKAWNMLRAGKRTIQPTQLRLRVDEDQFTRIV